MAFGYFETVCQLCGVSFAIGRLRRSDEPPEAGWNYAGSVDVDEDEENIKLCGESSGCRLSCEDDYELGEHIIGFGCISTRGYSGQRISWEEMRGCRAVQCLMKKEAEWQPEQDDQDFELNSDYFLSGIGDGSPDWAPLRNIIPIRHVWLGLRHYSNQNDEGLPFHPTCFEIFKRVSELRLGSVDVEGLWQWRLLEGTFEAFHEQFPREFAVRDGYKAWWKHEPGCEYLAANAVKVPVLPRLLASVHFAHSRAPRTVFGWPPRLDPLHADLDRLPLAKPGAVSDPFQKLPAENTDMIVSYLHSKHISTLGCASPAFRQLPMILFRRLLIEEMPWFWEAQSLPQAETDWYKLYQTVKFCWSNLKGLQNRRRIWKDVEEFIRRVSKYRSDGKFGKYRTIESGCGCGNGGPRDTKRAGQ